MAKRATKKKVCKCGAEIRPEAAFCYNCGNEIRQDKVAENPGTQDLPPIPAPEEGLKEFLEPQMAPPPEPVRQTFTQAAQNSPARRKRERPFKKRPSVVNVEWTEPGGSGASFLIWTSVFLVLCGLVIAAAMYIK